MIQINDKYAIKADKRCYMLCTPVKTKEGRSWKSEWYFTDIQHLFDKLIKLAVAEGINEGAWEAVLTRVQEAKKQITDIIEPQL